MLVLTRHPGDSLIPNFPEELGIDTVDATIPDDGKIGIDAPEEIEILRSELLDS